MKPEKIIEREGALRSARSNWHNLWQELTDYILPRKNDILAMIVPGEKKGHELFDSSGVQANEVLAGALHGLLTNPASIWFEYTTGNEMIDQRDDVRGWLQELTKRTHNVLNNTNFQTEIHECYLDIGCIGTFGLAIEEDKDRIVRFHSRPIKEYVVEENNLGVIDVVFRKFEFNARQIQDEFSKDLREMPRSVSEALKKGDNRKFTIIQGIFPPSFDPEERDFKFPFISQYVLAEDRKTLRKGGFKEWPFIVSRWSKIAGEMYGRSPGMKALPDVKMINAMMLTTLKGAQKVVDPPLQMGDDGVNQLLDLAPGAINYHRQGGDKIEPIITNARIDFGYQILEDVRKRIRDAFFIDQLQLQEGPQMTATEVLQRTEEKMRLLGPMLGRQHNEFLRPMVDRVFGIMARRGLIPEAPADIQGANLDVQYSSLVAKAQRTSEAQNLTRAFEVAAPFLQLDPGAADLINGDNALRFVLKIFGAPQELLRGEDEVQGRREARAEAQAQQNAQVDEAQGAETGLKTAQALQQVAKAQGV